MKHALLVASGGAAGSVLRWLVSGWVQHWVPRSGFPWGTFAVTVTGSFAIGVRPAFALERERPRRGDGDGRRVAGSPPRHTGVISAGRPAAA